MKKIVMMVVLILASAYWVGQKLEEEMLRRLGIKQVEKPKPKTPRADQFNDWLRAEIDKYKITDEPFRRALVKNVETQVWDASMSYGIPIDYLNGFIFLTGDSYVIAGDRAGPCLLKEGVARHYGLRTNGRLAGRLLDRRTRLLKSQRSKSSHRRIARLENQIRRCDERFNPVKAIPATSACLSYLHNKYGGWDMAFMIYRGNHAAVTDAAWRVTHNGFLAWGQPGSVLAAVHEKGLNWAKIVNMAESGKHPKTNYVVSSLNKSERQFWFRLLAATRLFNNQPIRLLADSR